MSGGGGSEQKPSPVEQAVSAQLKSNLFPASEGFFDRGTEGIFQGSRLAPTSDVTQAAQQQVLGLAPRLDQQTASLLQGFQPLLNTDVGDLEGTYLDTVNAENARQAELTGGFIDELGIQAGQTFDRNILPQIGEGAQAAGQFGGTRQNLAEGVAAADLQSNLNAQIAQLLQGDVIQGEAARESALNRAFAERSGTLDRALSASSLYPQLQQGQLLGTDLLSTLGGQLDQGNQFALEDQIQQSEAGRQAELRRLQEFQGLLGFSGPQQFQGSSSTSPNHLQTAIGGAAVAASLL
jgi:hypothetical protein